MTSQLEPVSRHVPVGRFAPSPTGDLHLGNLRTALEAWRDIRLRGGIFILRIEDIDAPRTVAGSEDRMLDDLRWLGIDWDEGPDVGGPAAPYRQSDRSAIYEKALGQLADSGLLYSCRCSRKDLREASAPHGPEGPIYPGTCRPVSDTTAVDRSILNSPPAGHAFRFRVDRDPVVTFQDERCGDVTVDLAESSGDFVVKRRDGLWAYQLACAVDDALMGVTRVVRGADLLSSTPRQIAIIRALELPIPAYRHISLVADDDGQRMSKRDGSQSLRSLRSAGASPAEVREMLFRMPLLENCNRTHG